MKKCSLVLMMLLLAMICIASAQTVQKKKMVVTPAAKAEPVNAEKAALPEVSRELVENYLKRVYGYDEGLSISVLEQGPSDTAGVTRVTLSAITAQGQRIITMYVMPDQTHVVMGEMLPFGADPFLSDRERLNREVFGPAKGPIDAPITIVEFADLECPACKAAQTNMRKLEADYPQVHFVYQNFPLPALHPWAQKAAGYLDCINRQSQEKAWQFIEIVYIHQDDVPVSTGAAAKLEHYAGMAGVDASSLAPCIASDETAQRVQRSVDLGKSLRVVGTPSVFINGRIVNVNIGYEALKSIVDFELLQAKAAAK